MKNFLIKSLILLGHLMIFVITLGFGLFSFASHHSFFYNPILLIYQLMTLALTFFITTYYVSMSESISQISPFMSIIFGGLQVSLLILSYWYSDFSCSFGISQMFVQSVLVFCAIAINLMIAGYGIFAHNKARTTINIFILGSFITSMFGAMMLPKIQGYIEFNRNFMLMLVLSLGTLINIFIFVVLLATEPPGTQIVRYITGLSLTIIAWLLFSYHDFYFTMINLAFAVVFYLVISVICRHNSIKL